jgi:transcription factor IIIB subunit 2
MPGPVAPSVPTRRPRLATINDSITYKASSSRAAPQNAASGGPPKKVSDPCPRCADEGKHTELSVEDDGSKACYVCGLSLEETNIVSEVTFGETAAGAAMVQGGFVGEGQRHANTMGGTMRGLGGMDSHTKTLWRGRDEIDKLCASLHRNNIGDMAFQLYKLANRNYFTQGRRVRDVAACCIYLADRKQPESTLLLMDLAEKIHVNIWKLGDIYKQFLKVIMDEDPSNLPDKGLKIPQLEPLMLKYCRKLEFGEDSYVVAEDACKLLKRMKRDWMVQGRQPAGICGACIILAARMNNFRRTVREVVYVVKVADSTINQRLYEFRRTKASNLTIDQFRKFGVLLKDNIMPPSIYKREEKEERKRKRAEAENGEEDVTAHAEVVAGANSSTTEPAPTKKRRKTAKGTSQPPAPAGGQRAPRRDADGFLIPDLSMNPNATEDDTMDFENDDHLEYIAAAAAPEEALTQDAIETAALAPKKKRGRPPKKREPMVIPSEDLEIEADLESDVMEGIRAWEDVFKQFDANENHPVLKAAGDKARALAQDYTPNAGILETEEVRDDEFEDDEDVANCLNTPAEARMKEKVWITQNEDWLRDQQAKMLQKELDDASGKVKKPKQRRSRNVMGDGSVLGGKPAADSAEAVKLMLEKRAKNFSSHINYDKLKELFPGQSSGPNSEVSTPAATPAASGPSKQVTQKPAPVEQVPDEELEDEEDYDEEHADYEDEFDDPNNYLDDEDVGFDEDDLRDDY